MKNHDYDYLLFQAFLKIITMQIKVRHYFQLLMAFPGVLIIARFLQTNVNLAKP